MKALTTLLFICLFSVSIIAQETEEKKQSENQKEELKEENGTPVSTEEKDPEDEEINSETETKSFTLDANDAVVEEMEVSEPYEREEIYESPSNTTYHYNGYGRNDDIQTLAGKNGHHGGFGAVSFRASEFNDKDIIMVGFRGGWIINRAMAIGFEGHGIIPTAEYENIDPNNSLNSRSVGGYGGMFIEPIILSNKVVHVTFPVSGGGGWLGYIVDWEQTNFYENDLIDDDVFWYVEPGAAIELNVARNFRINMGASYRFTKDLDLMSTPSSGFDAWNYFLTLKFGSF
jgi:hypothetical protein